ncbi:unnamed protein product, partial [Tilletia controversa]
SDASFFLDADLKFQPFEALRLAVQNVRKRRHLEEELGVTLNDSDSEPPSSPKQSVPEPAGSKPKPDATQERDQKKNKRRRSSSPKKRSVKKRGKRRKRSSSSDEGSDDDSSSVSSSCSSSGSEWDSSTDSGSDTSSDSDWEEG